MKKITVADVKTELNKRNPRSAWGRGVRNYAEELIETLDEGITGGWYNADLLASRKLTEKAMLNGADNWKQYSWGGSSLIYDADIAERLCNATELKLTRNGERRPNKREQWLDTQARALFQASLLILETIEKLQETA